MSDARILDRRYAHYDGPRFGVAHAVGSLTRQTVQRCLGLHRAARWKVLPFLAVIIAYLPAAVFVGIIALFPDQGRQARITYGEYYGFVIGAITLFVIFVAPEALCPDRRWRSLSMYLASPLNRTTYLVAKAIAVVTALSLVTIGPLVLLLIGFVLQNAGPHGPAGVVLVFARIIGSGLVLSINFAAISMAVSSFTERRAFAGAATFLLIGISQVLAGLLAFGLNGGDNFILLSLTRTPVALVQYIYGQRQFDQLHVGLAGLIATVLFTTLSSAAIVYFRYQRLQVTR